MTERSIELAAAKRAATELQERNRAAFEELGGRLRVSVQRASNLRTRSKELELTAEVEWEASHVHDHVHAKLAERPWFSRRWRVRSIEEARGEIEARLLNWLGDKA
jgi:hypothetical protein